MKLSIASAILCTVLLASFCNAFPYPDYWDDEEFLEQLQQEERVGADVEARIEQAECSFRCQSPRVVFISDESDFSKKTIQRPQSPIDMPFNYDCNSLASITIDGKTYFPSCFSQCPVLSISNGVVEYGIPNQLQLEPRDPDTTATYSCSGGYTLQGGKTRTCGRDGQWSGEAPTCIEVMCPELSDIPNGAVTVTNRRPRGIATYSCLGGYYLSGAQTRTCSQDGRWSGQEPTCFPLCPIPSLPNGQVNHGDREPGDVAAYSCRSGYRLKGPKERTCGQDSPGRWSGVEPVCEVIICPLVNPIPNGDSSSSRSPIRGPGGSQGFGVGTVVTYTCDTNFELRGESTRSCQESGEWDRPEPSCAETKCPELKLSDIPKNVPEADRKLKRSRNYQQLRYKQYYTRRIEGDHSVGSKAYLTCKNGWKLMRGTPAVQTCVSENGALVWTKAGTCVYSYSYPSYG